MPEFENIAVEASVIVVEWKSLLVVHPWVPRSVNTLIRSYVPGHVDALLQQESSKNQCDCAKHHTQSCWKEIVPV